jgi:hypothetical protein
MESEKKADEIPRHFIDIGTERISDQDSFNHS